jgi:uncharacterized protein (DUF1810 family)
VAAIERFVEAQDAGGQFASALAEMTAGRKQGHWIWYVFPQLSGLGLSRMSQIYAIRDRDEAEAYLRHPVLYSRLQTITSAVAEQVRQGVRVDALMSSSIDAQKLVSSLTLFSTVARSLSAPGDKRAYDRFAAMAEEILAAAASHGYPPCRQTIDRLSR